MSDTSRPGYYGFKIIGALKFVSGLMALAVGIGATRFLANDPGPGLERAVTHLGLDPRNEIIQTLISKLTGLDGAHLRAIQAGTFFYAILHSIEGTGLLLGQAWAGYLVVIATGALIPFEIYEIAIKPTPLRFSLFLLNVMIVVYLIIAIRKEHMNRTKHVA